MAICARGKEALEKAAEAIKAKEIQVLAVHADVAKQEDIKSIVAKTIEKFGRIDVLVNNAGTGRLSDLMQLPEEEFRYNMDLMFFGLIQCSKEVVPYMREQGREGSSISPRSSESNQVAWWTMTLSKRP